MLKIPKIQLERVHWQKPRDQASSEVMEVRAATFNSAMDALHLHEDANDEKMHVIATLLVRSLWFG